MIEENAWEQQEHRLETLQDLFERSQEELQKIRNREGRDEEEAEEETEEEGIVEVKVEQLGKVDVIDLPDFKLMRYLALRDFLYDQEYPPNLRGNLLGRIKIERPKLFEQLLGEEKKMEKESEKESEKSD